MANVRVGLRRHDPVEVLISPYITLTSTVLTLTNIVLAVTALTTVTMLTLAAALTLD